MRVTNSVTTINAGQIWQDKRDERRVIKVLSVRNGVVEYLRRYETGTKRQTTGLALVRSFRGDYKMIAEQEEQR